MFKYPEKDPKLSMYSLKQCRMEFIGLAFQMLWQKDPEASSCWEESKPNLSAEVGHSQDG